MNKKQVTVIIAVLVAVFLLSLFILFNRKAVPPELGTVRLNIETYLAGENQPTHPSVAVFPNTWNGAKYWLAYSPYPYGNGEEENPCLAISDDMLYWETPFGLANPIADNEETGCDELKDPHLVYREDLNRLEMWYLGRLSENLGGDGRSLLLMRKYSQDGINWSEYEVMTTTKYLSPTIIWDGAKYQMWGIGYDLWDTSGIIAYQESVDGIIWSDPVRCTLGSREENNDIWHGSVTKQDGKYHFVFIDESDKQEVFYCNSVDGIHFSEPYVIVDNNEFWDFLYRPTLVFDEDGVFCLYGAVNHANQWFITMSRGPDVNNLRGIEDSDLAKMQYLTDTPIDTHSVRYMLKEFYGLLLVFLRLELLVLAVPETLLLVALKRLRSRNFLILCVLSNFLLSLAYIYVRMCPASGLSWLGAIMAVCCLNLGISAVLQCVSIFLCKGKINEIQSA